MRKGFPAPGIRRRGIEQPKPRTARIMIEFTGNTENSYGGKKRILTLTDQVADQESNQGRICCQTNQPSKSGGTRGTFGYKRPD